MDLSDLEVLNRAELRVYMKTPDGSVIDPVYLRLYHGGHKGSYKKVNPSREGWIVFDVLDHLQRWRASNYPHKHIHFYITTYTSFDDLTKGENGKNCHDGSSIQFEVTNNTSGDIDQQPQLMIYSYDLEVLNFNTTAIKEAAEANESTGVQRCSVIYSETEPPTLPELSTGCIKHEYEISLDTLNEIWHLAQPSQLAVYPPRLNINVCGGGCNRNLPSRHAAQHSIIPAQSGDGQALPVTLAFLLVLRFLFL